MKYKSELMGAIHETAQDLHQAGLLSDEKMKHFDEACLTRAEPLTGDEIRAIREKEQLTQAAFAIHLNIGKNQVSDLNETPPENVQPTPPRRNHTRRHTARAWH